MEKFHNREIGVFGEDEAVRYLKNCDYQIICRNFIVYYGEIDIIALDKDEYVFVEVKTRTSHKYGNAIDAVDFNKKKHILSASKYYIYLNKLQNRKIRFDIIEIYINKNGKLINHFKNVFF